MKMYALPEHLYKFLIEYLGDCKAKEVMRPLLDLMQLKEIVPEPKQEKVETKKSE